LVSSPLTTCCAGKQAFIEFLHGSCNLDVSLRDLRLVLPVLTMDAVAISGQACALSAWHQAS
jgi:hypothetical protein